jgi:hypothetical protein
MVVAREGGRSPRRAPRPWRRRLVALALALAPAAIVLLGASGPNVAAADPTALPSPGISPTPTPTATPTPRRATLKVVKTDPAGTTITTPGAKFNVHIGAADGRVVATLTTDGSGTASVDTLASGTTYCLEETGAPAGFRAEPAYTPDACASLVAGTPSVISVADPPAPTPTPTPPPTPTPTPVQTGELQITKDDTNGQVIATPGFTFNVRVGSATGQVIATIATDGSGTAIAGALNPAIYCVEETTAADGYQVAPSYSPSACVAVASDPTQGRSPTIVTVTDPASATPSPSAAAPSAPPASPSAPGRLTTSTPTAAGLPVAALARVLVVLGVLLLGIGGVLVALSIRRRRLRTAEPPPDTWYDSTIT